MNQTVKYFKKESIHSVEVVSEIEQYFEKYPAQPEEKNFFGKVTKKAIPGGYYYRGNHPNLESLLAYLNRDNRRYIIKDGKIFSAPGVKVSFRLDDGYYYTADHFFETYDEALAVGNLIAMDSDMTCIPNYSEINQKTKENKNESN